MLMGYDDEADGTSNHDIVESIEYTKHRILHGVPEGNDDMVPLHAFPMESNLDIMGARELQKTPLLNVLLLLKWISGRDVM